MKLMGFTIDIEPVIEQIKSSQINPVLLQVPEGLKHKAIFLSDMIEQKTQASCYIQVDPCFGACDLISSDMLASLNIEAVVHLGHRPIPSLITAKPSIPIFFVEVISTHEIGSIVQQAMSHLEGNRIGILTTAQHLHMLGKVKSLLRKKGFTPVLSNGDARIDGQGQILGCNFSAGTMIADSVDSFLFIGSGVFHSLGLLLSVKKPVVIADPYLQQVKKDELIEFRDSILRQRYGAIAQAKTATSFGILIGLKIGQQRKTLAERIHTLIKKRKKKSFLFTVDFMSPSVLESFPTIDCFVSTLCPRVAIDDYTRYKTPVITPVECEIAMGLRSWDEYVFDEIKQ